MGRDDINALCDALEAVELQFRSKPTILDSIDREADRQRQSTEDALAKLEQVRREIELLKRRSTTAQDDANRFDRIECLVGRVE